jgi:hypothetical protein
VTPTDLFWFIVATGAGLVVVAVAVVMVYLVVQLAVDLLHKWAGR